MRSLKKLTEIRSNTKESEEVIKKLNEVKNALKKTYVLVEVVQTQVRQIEDLTKDGRIKQELHQETGRK